LLLAAHLGIVAASGALTIVGLGLLVFSYRLTVAYGRYLCFEHAVPTVLSSQAIVFLLLGIGDSI